MPQIRAFARSRTSATGSDAPSFETLVPSQIYAKVGSLLSVPLSTMDPDGDSRKIEVIGLPAGKKAFGWQYPT